MNEYIAIASCDNLLPDKKYLGYDDGNTVVLTHAIGGNRVIQLHNPIYTILNNVKATGNKSNIGLESNLSTPFPREREHLFNINK